MIRKRGGRYLNHQPDAALGLDKGIRMRHNHCVDLLVRYWRLVQAGVEPPGINLTGNLLGLHAMAGIRQKVDYGFGEGHTK